MLVEGQAPWAGIITCADSRVPPSWIFDVSSGQLFVVRSAGSTAFDDGVASMEYAVANLGVSLIRVQPIRASFAGDVQDLEQGVESNARSAAGTLTLKSEVLAGGVEAGTLNIHGAVYDIASSQMRLV